MKLSNKQIDHVLQVICAQRVSGYSSMDQDEKDEIEGTLIRTVLPALRILPPNTRPEDVASYKDLFRRIAMDLLENQLKDFPLVSEEEAVKLLELVPEELLEASINSIISLSMFSLEVLEPDSDFEEMSSLSLNFDEVDLDDEMKKLCE